METPGKVRGPQSLGPAILEQCLGVSFCVGTLAALQFWHPARPLSSFSAHRGGRRGRQPHVCPFPSYLVDQMKGLIVRGKQGRLTPGASEVLGSLGVAELSPDSLDPVVQLLDQGPPCGASLAKLSWILFA